MEHTESNIETDISLLTSLLKVLAVFQMRLLYHGHNEDVVEAILILLLTDRSPCPKGMHILGR